MPTYLLLGVSLINALIIITLLFEAACVGVARRRHRSSIDKKLNPSAINCR
ncbi:MAG: hypothetical protein V7K38_13100 [Nostoc sp.]|uniref:hypothetical protein n=1 Tax=Nostoc sp. TaxID=1180 RepID=UPI002FF6DED9